MKQQPIDRRRHERFATAPMYTTISARTYDESGFSRHGHAYDISEGGVRFELDQPIEPGTSVDVQIRLPTASIDRSRETHNRPIYAMGTVVWCETGEPGPAKLAVAFSCFAHDSDRERLLDPLRTHGLGRVA